MPDRDNAVHQPDPSGLDQACIIRSGALYLVGSVLRSSIGWFNILLSISQNYAGDDDDDDEMEDEEDEEAEEDGEDDDDDDDDEIEEE